MSEYDPADFRWISAASECLNNAGYEPDSIKVDSVSGRVMFVYNPGVWGCGDE